MIKRVLYILISSLAVSLYSCGDDKRNVKNDEKKIDVAAIDTSLEKANRYMLLQEFEWIDDYVERHKLIVNQTGTGLRYQILKEGDGDLIKRGDIVTLEYEVDLITGDRVYSSKEDGNKTFVVGRGGVESGIEEAILKLRNNSVAVLILPSHLAHGLLGDGERIPPKSPIVYYVKVIDVKNK